MRVHFKDLVNKPKSYWDLLADHICTKTREIGRVSGYEKAGIKYVQFRAHLDDRTTEICKHMHGRIIAVSDMRNQVDGYLAACETQSKDKIKEAWPWVKDSDAKGNTQDMIGKKVSLPPLHARCRSITVAYFDNVDTWLQYGEDVDRKEKKVVNQWTPPEHRNFVDDLKFRAKDLEWRDKDFRDDIVKEAILKHAKKDFQISSQAEYRKKAADIIAESDKTFISVYKGSEVQYKFASSKHNGYVIVDRNGKIRGCYGHPKDGAYDKWLNTIPRLKNVELRS